MMMGFALVFLFGTTGTVLSDSGTKSPSSTKHAKKAVVHQTSSKTTGHYRLHKWVKKEAVKVHQGTKRTTGHASTGIDRTMDPDKNAVAKSSGSSTNNGYRLHKWVKKESVKVHQGTKRTVSHAGNGINRFFDGDQNSAVADVPAEPSSTPATATYADYVSPDMGNSTYTEPAPVVAPAAFNFTDNRSLYLNNRLLMVYRGEVRGLSAQDRYNMTWENLANALSDTKTLGSDARIRVATTSKPYYMGSYRFDVHRGDRILMMANHTIAVLTPEGAALNGTTMDREAQLFRSGLRSQIGLMMPRGRLSSVMILPHAFGDKRMTYLPTR